MSNLKICTIEIAGGKEVVKFAKKYDLKEKLSNIRIKLGNQITNEIIFRTNENSEINIEDEDIFTLEDIIDGKLIHMIIKNNKNTNKSSFNIYINGNYKLTKELEKSSKLSQIRNLLNEIITEKGIFLSQDGEILKEDEKHFSLDDIIEGNKIYIKLPSRKLTNNNNSQNIKPEIETTSDENMPNAPGPIPKSYPLKNSILIGKIDNLEIYEYPKIELSEEENEKAIKIMVIGPTGSGKTTLINSYVNFLMGINYSDNFRYIIINEVKNLNDAHSQTSEVTSYNIKAYNNKIYQIIDTPGFGDTKGIEKDEEITNKISYFFLKKTSELNSICLVLKSSDNRLAACQKYIFNCIFDLFGEDMKKIFLAMLTFCDGGKPQVLNALQDENCLFSHFLLSLGKEWYYKFNNSAIFEKNEEDILNLTYWNIGMSSFEKFTKKLDTLPKVNLKKTRRVLELRSHLNINIEILSKKLKEGLNKMDELKQIYKIISDIKGDINDSRNYTKKIKVNKSKEVKTQPGVYMTTCLICTKTCHRNCIIADDNKKDGCGAMNWTTELNKNKRHCLYCPKKCHWTQHKNRPYEIVDYQEEQIITLDYVKHKYFKSNSNLISKSETLRNIKTQLINLNIECMETQNKMMKCINEIHKIALNKSVYNSVEEHIDELILVEKAEHKDGWQNRVEGLLILKKQKHDYRILCEGKNNDLITMSNFIKSSFEDDKALEEFISKENGTNINQYKKCNIF
jgi:GTP-binding protein EngB required for normal cell division